MIDNIVALDLEMNQPSGTIIKVGVAVGSLKSKTLLFKKGYIINVGEVLDPRIIDLCGISQLDIHAGISLRESYEQLKTIMAQFECFMNPLTWGGGDSETYRSQLGNPDRWIFGRRWIDVKTLFISRRIAQGLSVQGGLARSMTKMGLAFEGRKHRADDDAANTFKMYCRLLEEFKQ